MHQILVFIVGQIALSHQHWRAAVARARPLSARIASLEETRSAEAETALLRSRLCRIRPFNRPYSRSEERYAILIHAARYRISVTQTARILGVSPQTTINWQSKIY